MSKFRDLEVAKGLAICLVVYGHLVARGGVLDNEWYTVSKQILYSFHMSFFMFLSGLVFFLKLKPCSSVAEFFSHTKKRFNRLMPAYILFAVVVFLGKMFFYQFAHVDNFSGEWLSFFDVFLYPMKSFSAFLWYLYALFVISMISLALFSFFSNSFFVLIFFGVALWFLPYEYFLGLGQVTKYLGFFLLGGWAARNIEVYYRYLAKYWILSLFLFVASIFYFYFLNDYKYSWIVVSLFSLLALHGVSRYLLLESELLFNLGGLVMCIYLMNTISIGVVKSIFYNFVPWQGEYFLFFYVPILFISGVFIPVFIKKYLIAKVSWLDKITN